MWIKFNSNLSKQEMHANGHELALYLGTDMPILEVRSNE